MTRRGPVYPSGGGVCGAGRGPIRAPYHAAGAGRRCGPRWFASGSKVTLSCLKINTLAGGEGEIRTPDRLAPMPHFECGAFDHSATSPQIGSQALVRVGIARGQ